MRADRGRLVLPDFLIMGAPKAGTTALHNALCAHPDLYLSPVKEPKFFLCDEEPPTPQRGPGDAHSAREWIWSRERYEALFAAAPPHARRGESTPFYLYDRAAHARIAKLVPDARLIVVVRDPVDRAYSNWMHLWSDGLEPEADFVAAWRLEDERVRAGWAPFWHYRRLGRYGEQLDHLLRFFQREQVHVLRYRDLVDSPVTALDGICAFLGVRAGLLDVVPPDNSRSFVAPGTRANVLGQAIRVGARLGAHAPPEVWRAVSRPLVRARQWRGVERPKLTTAARGRLVRAFADDIPRLEAITGMSFGDWLAAEDRGQFTTRRAAAMR